MSENLQVPKFNFSGRPSITLEDISKEESKGPKFLLPGVYTAKVTGVEYKGQTQKSEDWAKFVVRFTASNDKTTSTMVLVPGTDDVSYNGSTYPYRRLKGILAALGLDVSSDKAVMKSIESAFQNPAKSTLLNKEAELTVGYTGPYIELVREPGSKEASYVVMVPASKTEAARLHPALESETFADRDSAAQKADHASIKIQNFPEIVNIAASKKTTLKSASSL